MKIERRFLDLHLVLVNCVSRVSTGVFQSSQHDSTAFEVAAAAFYHRKKTDEVVNEDESIFFAIKL